MGSSDAASVNYIFQLRDGNGAAFQPNSFPIHDDWLVLDMMIDNQSIKVVLDHEVAPQKKVVVSM